MPNIADNINFVRHRLQKSAEKAGRNVEDITLLAVSKGQPVSALRAAITAGLHQFGESYLQEALAKMEALGTATPVQWHFIGPVQANKTRPVAQHFAWVHSVDRVKIARRLSEQRPAHLPPLNVCLQVNLDGEHSKSGLAPEAVAELALAVVQLSGLRLRGLMAIPMPVPAGGNPRKPFARLAQLLADLKGLSPALATLDTLSMGMSADMGAAIAEGATIVRVGTAIFGERKKP